MTHAAMPHLSRARTQLEYLRSGLYRRTIPVILVCGTRGKTTTAMAITAGLEEAGYRPACLTPDFTYSNAALSETIAGSTQFHPKELFSAIHALVEQGHDYLVLATPAGALSPDQVSLLKPQIIVIAHIGNTYPADYPDNAHYHQALEHIISTPSAKTVVFSADEPQLEWLLSVIPANKRFAVGIEQDLAAIPELASSVTLDKIVANTTQSSCVITDAESSSKLRMLRPTELSVQTAALAIAACRSLNLGLETITTGIAQSPVVPGRLESIETRKGFSILIDTAHDSDSLERLLAQVRPDVRGRIIFVLALPDSSDTRVRSIIGALAARFCDQVIITNLNSSQTSEVVDDIAKAIPRGRSLFRPSRDQLIKTPAPRPIMKKADEADGESDWWWRITDRTQAITKAVLSGKLDDLVLIAGYAGTSDSTLVTSVLTEHNLQ
jgi:UDP-N-acetylmuramoyl-L-alanyl-D-glutamate--2,6-diaminopimelate ligase